MDLNPDGTRARFNFIFQVWRPAPNVTISGCYSLVDDFISTSIPIGIRPTRTVDVARITPLPANQLQFQPGDVLGFYVESHGEFLNDPNNANGDANNGVALLTSGNYTSESVWYGSIGDGTAQISRTDSCPYPVGTSGFLRSSTLAAPAISISIATYSCHQSSSTTVASSIISILNSSMQSVYSSSSSYSSSVRIFSTSLSMQPTYSTFTDSRPISMGVFSTSNMHLSSTTTNIILSTPTVANVPGSLIHHIGLISGVVAASVIVCISTVIVTAVVAISIAKQRKKVATLTHDQTSSGIALSNQVYGELLQY